MVGCHAASMKIPTLRRPVALHLRPRYRLSEPFAFLPVVVVALNKAEVSCRFCSVKMVSRAGLIRGICPTCFEERCATCGDEVVVRDGELVRGLAVGPGGSWKCAKCVAARLRRPATSRGG